MPEFLGCVGQTDLNLCNSYRYQEGLLQIVLGKRDEVIGYHDTLAFLKNNIGPEVNYLVHIHNTLSHRIGIDIFKVELETFFLALKHFTHNPPL